VGRVPTAPWPDDPAGPVRRQAAKVGRQASHVRGPAARAGRQAAEVGRQALGSFRRRVTERLIEALDQRDPELLANLAEIGVMRREWVEDPESGPISAPPVEVAQRLLERAVERRPSVLTQLGLSAVQLLSSPSAASDGGITDQLTVMFTDLEGFTRFTSRQGDEAAGALLTEHHRAVGPVIRSRGGRIVKRLGDGLLLTFPEPEAAVLAGLELVAQDPVPLRLRAGAHVGDVLVLPDDVIGHTVNVAARVTELARGGQVLVTGEVRSAIGDELDGLTFTRPRTRHLKGLDAGITVCRAQRHAG
jgi:adenylate cyclase